MQASPITGKEKCAEKLNQMKKYLPFIDFMINKIKEKADTLPLESQLSKFQVLKAMISEKNEIVSLGRVLRMEDVIQQLILRLNYQGQNGTVNEESTGRSRDEKKGNNTRVKDESTLAKVKDEPKNRVNVTSPSCTTPSSTAPSVSVSSTSSAQNVGVTNTVDVLTSSRDNNVPVTGRKDMSNRRSNDTRTITPPDNSSSETKNRRRMSRSNDNDSDGSKFRDKSNSNRNTNNSIGPGVPEETKPRTDSLSSSRGMPVKSYPSTSQQTFSQSHESHTNIDNREQTPSGNYHGFITYENLNYRSDHPERVTVRDGGKKPQLSDRNGQKRDSNRRHSNERSVYPVEDSRRDRTVSPSDSLASRSSDFQSKTRLKDRSSSDSNRGHRSSEDVREPRKDSGSRNDNDLEVVEVTSPNRLRSTGKSQEGNSRRSLASERSRRHKTNSGLSESRREKRKSNSGGSVHQRKRRRVHVSNLSDYQLQKFVRKNMHYLPHLASLKTSEIREAIAVLGDEIFEGPSRSPIQTQDLDDFVNSEDSSECTSSKFPEVRSSVCNAENKNSECRVEEEDSAENTNRVIEVSENDSVLESDGSNPKDIGDDEVSDDFDFTKDTFDEFRPNIQPVSEKALLELTLPEPDELDEETLRMEPASKSVPSEESNVNKAGCIEPSEKVQNPIHVRRHSSHSTTVQSTPSYRTKDIVYDNWRASTLTSTVVTIQGSNQTTQSNSQFDSQSIMASSSQSNHDMLNQMGNINVSQTVTNARVQQTNLFSPPLVNTNPEQGGEISNSSQPLEATSYAEYKRLKNMEIRKLNQKPKLPKVTPQTSPESSVGGRVAGDENVPKRTQAVQTSRHGRSDRHTVFREEKTVTSPRDRRHSDYGGSRIQDKVIPNERARKDVDRGKRSDSEKISSSDTEETISPLDSLYKSEPKPQTGRGYGLQHFRIPKKGQSNTSSDKNTKFHTENIRKNNMVDENRSRSEESADTNKHDNNSAHKGDESRDSSEQTTNTSKNDKDMSRKGEEKNTSLEGSTTKIKNDVDTSRKEREHRDSSEQTTNISKNDKDMSRKEEEDGTSPEKSTIKIKSDVDTSHKEKGHRESLKQTTNTSKNDKDMSRKEEDGTSPERSTTKIKNDVDTNHKERGHRESLKQTTNKAQSVKKVSRKGEKDCDIPKRPQKSSTADKKARHSVEENMDSSDEKANKKENVGDVKGEPNSRETTPNTTEQTNREIVSCHETTANTSDKNIIGNVDDNSNSREAIQNTTAESNESKFADGNFFCHETAANTKEDDRNKDDDVKLDDLEEGIKTNDNKENEKGLGEKKTHERLESLDDKGKIEEDDSSDSDWIDVETIEDREPQATERDGQPGRTSNSIQDDQEVTDTSPVKSEKDVSMDWVKTFVVGCFKNKNKKIADVLRRIHRLSVEEIEIIEKIINSAFDDPSANNNEREHRGKSNKKNENGENRESVGGSAENSNVEVDKRKKKSNSKNQKPSSSEIKKNKSEGEASEKNTEEAAEEKTKKATDKGMKKTIKKEVEEPSEKEMEGVKEKEMEINIKSERSDSANDSLESNSNEEPKQLESTVTDVKKKVRRCRRRREGMDFVIRKRNRKTPRKQEQKQLLEESKKLTSTAGADTGNLNSGEAQEPKRKLKGKTKSELDRLHDDIRSMFISSEVIKATGQRACRMLRECANNTNNADIVRESAKAVEEQLRKMGARNASRNGSRRNATNNYAGPSSTVTDETNRGPVVKDYHVSTQWPRIVMQKIDLNNLGYGEKISDTSVTFCRQKGSNKAIRSERKRRSEPNTSLINNENVTKNIKSEKSGSKSTRGDSKGKKKTETEKSKPARTAQTKQPETLGRDVEEKPKDTNQRNRSSVIVSSGGKKEPVEDLSGDSLLNYAFEKTKKVYSCKLCPLVTEEISSHYKIDHPKSEILISRLSKTEAADAIREAAESDFEDNDLEDTPLHLVKNILSYRQKESSGYYCRMCSRPKITSVGFFFAHVSEHTGEHRYKCPSKGCNVTVPRRVLMRKHIIRAHPGSRFKRCEKVIILFPVPAESGCLYGFICSRCNFVQVHRKNLEKHIRRQHGGDKNIAIIKINLSSKNPLGDENTCNKDHQEVVAKMTNDIQASEQGKSNDEDIKNTGHKEAGKVYEGQKRAEKRKHKDCPKLEESTGLRGDANSNEEVGSKRPFLDAELETEIEVDESPSYLLKPEKFLETDSEAHLETNYETNLETNFEAGLDEHFEADSEPNLKSHLEAHLKPNPETNMETEQVEVDECADLRRFATIRGSDIIDPIESSDSRDTDSRDTDSRDANLRDAGLPFTTVASTLRPESDIEALKVGPLTAHLLDQTNVLYECYTKGCLFSTTSYVIFEKHLKISHSGIRWNGHCQVCRKNVRNKLHKNWPPIAFTLPSALVHLKTHARHALCQGSECLNKVDLLGADVDNNILNLNQVEESEYQRIEGDSSYPQKPLLRVRNLLGDRLSRPKDCIINTSQQDTAVNIVQEEPTASGYTEGIQNESLMFTIQDVRSLNPEVGCGSKIQFEEVVSPVKSVREQAKVVARQPVIVRSCPTRQIAIRPDTSGIPIEVGHLQVVQAPVSSSSVALNPLTDSTLVTTEAVTLGTLPNSTPVRITSSVPSQTSAPRFPLQPIMISAPSPLRSPTQVATLTTNSQAVVPNTALMEHQPGSSSRDLNATVEQPVAQTVVDSNEIGIPQMGGKLRRQSVVQIGMGPTLPPLQPGEIGEADPSLQKAHLILPFGNKANKGQEIYKEMLKKEKLCHLFKCMASDCSFTCNNQTMFDGHINMHEANKRGQNPMLLKKGKKVYSWQECPYCCEVVTNPSLTLSRHIVDVHGHCIFQCAFCFYRAVSLNYVDIHQEVGHEELAKRNCRLIYKCRKFSNGQRMPTGLEMDTVEECVKPYICVECESKFLIPEEFQNHLIREHQPKPAYTCHICKNQSLKADRLIAHYRRHHFARHQCYYCLHGKDAESAMVIHLCTRHFTHTPLVYKRVLAGGASVQGDELPLGSLKVITYNEVVSPHCKIELEEGSEDDENLANQESQELNAIVAELGITAEGEPGSSVPLVQERVPMRNNSAQDVSVTALLPNARFSSEDESGSGTVLISSGLSTQCRREVSASESVENNNLLGQVPLETVNYQTPVSSQSVIMSRFDVNSERMSRSTTVIVERSQATTTSCNLPVTSTVTSNVNPIPPAVHRLPQVVLTVNRGATVLVQKERSNTKVLRTSQAEESPAASSRDTNGDTSVSRDPQPVVVNPLQQESSINVESTVLTMSESNVKNSEGENNTESKPEKRKVVERSTDQTIQKQTQNPKNEVTNEKEGIQENEMVKCDMASTEVERKPTSLLPIENVINSLYKSLKTETPEENDVGTNTTEEASGSGAGSLPRTRFSSLRPMYRSDVVVRRNSREKSAVKKKCAEELTGESLYICGNRGCSFAAPRERQLLEHLVVCDDSRNFPLLECPHCSKMFKNNFVFLEHLKTHGLKKLSCGLCSYKSGLESSIVKHAKLKHRCKQLKALPTEPPKEGYLVYYPKNYKKEKQDFMESGYSPGDEDKLPLQSVYQINVKCAKCPYFTKVRSNMVRHLKIHAKSTETEGVVVPSTAPMNPVPCLDSKEKMFDKMTNLAASSQLAQAKERNATETLTPEEIAKLPQLVDEHMRYKCCLPDCKYITVDEGILKHHIKALHAEVTYYSCPHCKSTVHTDIRHVALEKIGFHLKHHDSKLYKCAHCIYFHYQKAIVEKHTFDKHPDRRFFVHTVREPTPEEDNSVVETGTTVWKCVLCNDFQGPSKASVLDHLCKIHRTKSLYKCQFCDMKSNHGQSFTSHFASKHPGQSVSYFSTMIKQTVSSSESATISEPANDHFDTTPLWQRGASRVRHIRGILIEEEEVKRKKSKKAVEHTDSTSPQAATRTLASKPTSTPASSPVKAVALILSPTSTSASASTSTAAPTPVPSSTPTLTSTRTSAPTPVSSPVKTLALILAPTSTSTPAPALAPSLVSTLASASATAPSPVSTPARTLASTSTPALTPSPVKTLALILTPTSTLAPAVSPVRTSSRPQAPAPSPSLVSAPARTQTSPAPSTSVSTPSPTRIMNRDRTSARAPTSIPVPLSTQTLATISTSTPTPSPVPTSIPSSSPVESSASTSAPSSEDQDVQRPSEKEAFVANQKLEKRRTRSHLNKKEALPRGQEDITFWVNSIIEQQRMEIERGRQLSEKGGDSNDSQKSSRKRKKSDQDD